ncbi:OmpA family protein [Moraxella nasovis]|uniref:OmpA family protein n=1 Tax=Moraxella nasovis TaxID=2904121 RepID=UPI001F609144|nr:OmpA family protein [Moraxella nasovis]UNU72946.1 OmpA family protein [Moraxella nasovis]
MKKLTALSALSIAAFALTGCMGTKAISQNITEQGTIAAEDIYFPKLDSAWQKDGQFPNRENLSKIRAGVAKDELYQLIGRPHFNEANKAREWDYILKFHRPDDSVQVCQYKVIFDKDYRGQEFYWLPADCAAYAKPPATPAPVIVHQPAPPPVIIHQPAPQPTPIVNERIRLEADALFKFDKYKLEDMLPAGRATLDELAVKLLDWQSRGDSRIQLVGHTDRYASEEYNQTLSERRAMTVRNYLVSKGINPTTITAAGAGELQPLPEVVCSTTAPKQEQVRCLQPNRRVEVAVQVYARTENGSQLIEMDKQYNNFNQAQ